MGGASIMVFIYFLMMASSDRLLNPIEPHIITNLTPSCRLLKISSFFRMSWKQYLQTCGSPKFFSSRGGVTLL